MVAGAVVEVVVVAVLVGVYLAGGSQLGRLIKVHTLNYLQSYEWTEGYESLFQAVR